MKKQKTYKTLGDSFSTLNKSMERFSEEMLVELMHHYSSLGNEYFFRNKSFEIGLIQGKISLLMDEIRTMVEDYEEDR